MSVAVMGRRWWPTTRRKASDGVGITRSWEWPVMARRQGRGSSARMAVVTRARTDDRQWLGKMDGRHLELAMGLGKMVPVHENRL